MVRAGIDPGITGGIAFLGDGKFIAGFRMPVSDKRIDARALAELLRMYAPEEVVVEHTQAMPKNGSIASFSLGYSTGIIEGVVQTLSLPLVRIRPQEWKKLSGLTGKDKKASNALAKNLWPTNDAQWNVLANNGIAEAALLARAQGAKYVKEANA